MKPLVLLTLCVSACGMEDFRNSDNDPWTGNDKVQHAVVGAFTGAAVNLAIAHCAPESPRWARVLAGFAAAAAAGYLKEAYDEHHRDEHSPSAKDWACTAASGLAGALTVELVFKF